MTNSESIRARQQSSRRNFLKGMGALVALPALEAFWNPVTALGMEPAAGMTSAGTPLRMAFVTFPNGVNYKYWKPEGIGSDFTLNNSMASLNPLKDKLQVFSGFAADGARSHGDGAGDHARANAAILTGTHPRKTSGADISCGVSIDQVAAREIGHQTRIPSLQLSCEKSRVSGNCDSGYSCAYQFNLSWASPNLPVAAESNPRAVFERLFGSGSPGQRQASYEARLANRRSILDYVMEDARRMSRRVSSSDQQKIDQYLTSIRTIEQQIQQAESFPLPETGATAPGGVPGTYREHIDLMFDLLALSFETDSTRIATFALAHEGSGRSFPELGISEGHHYLSHHGSDQAKTDKIAKIDAYYAERLSAFLTKLNSIREVDGSTLLDNSMIMYGCGIGDGNRHNHDDLPIIVAGGAGGTFQTGRHVKFSKDVPLSNLYLSMIDRYGIKMDRFGDSTEVLKDV